MVFIAVAIMFSLARRVTGSHAMNRPRIEVADLVVRYGDVTAVDDIGFDIAPGELVTLLGPSGCGKTTTLRAVAGLETPDRRRRSG